MFHNEPPDYTVYTLVIQQMNWLPDIDFRHKLRYVVIYYLPTSLFVITSWASFLIPPEVVAGRMAMLITLFLVLVNIFGQIVSWVTDEMLLKDKTLIMPEKVF